MLKASARLFRCRLDDILGGETRRTQYRLSIEAESSTALDRTVRKRRFPVEWPASFLNCNAVLNPAEGRFAELYAGLGAAYFLAIG
jgi:hypothetical protein